MNREPRLLLTMGDVAGIGPEVIARAWPALTEFCRPTVVGSPVWMQRALRLVRSAAEVRVMTEPNTAAASPTVVPCLPSCERDLSQVGQFLPPWL